MSYQSGNTGRGKVITAKVLVQKTKNNALYPLKALEWY